MFKELIEKPLTKGKMLRIIELIALDRFRFKPEQMDDYLKSDFDFAFFEDGANFFSKFEGRHKLIGFIYYDDTYDYRTSRRVDRLIIVHNKGITKIATSGKITHKNILI